VRIVSELPGLTGERPVHCVTGVDLCDLLGITAPMLTELKRRGIAVHLRHDAYDLTATVRAYVEHLRGIASGRGGEEHVASLTAERARLAREQADGQALRNAQLRGELIRADEAERAWADALRALRGQLLALPARLRAEGRIDAAAEAAFDAALRATLAGLGGAQAGGGHG